MTLTSLCSNNEGLYQGSSHLRLQMNVVYRLLPNRMVLRRSCWLQVNSEFQAFKHIDIRSRGEMARAVKSLEATLALQPTLILTNSLPCSLDVIVWQVWSMNHQCILFRVERPRPKEGMQSLS